MGWGTAAVMVASAVSSASKGSSARKATKDKNKFEAEEAQKQRDHEMALRDKEINRYKNAIAAWKDYDTGAKPLVRRPTAGAPSPTDGVVPPQQGLLASAVPYEPVGGQPTDRRW